MNALVAAGQSFSRRIDRGLHWLKQRPRIYPAALAILGTITFAVPLLFTADGDEHVSFLGRPFGEPCGFWVTTGMPCPQCGMTRSWIWAARGHFGRAFLYNPAGATLFAWIVLAGLLGYARLATGNKSLLELPPRALLALTLTWILALYTVPWILRIGWQINPLPAPYFSVGVGS